MMTPAKPVNGHVTQADCKTRCGTVRWIVGVILLGISIIIVGIGYVWAGTLDAEEQCETATAQFGQHQAAEAERDIAMEARLVRMQTNSDQSFLRIEKQLDTISRKLP